MNTHETYPHEYRSYVGLHYKAEGRTHCCMQLLNEEGKAVAIADFENSKAHGLKLTRFEFADHAKTAATNWKDGLLSAPVSEMLVEVQS